jgi:phosphoenolpyruvate carboxykinase (ATP)
MKYSNTINSWFDEIGINFQGSFKYNCNYVDLIEDSIKLGEAKLADNGALVCNTGLLTGRSPKDRFIVKDELTELNINWNKLNQPFDPGNFDALYKCVVKYLSDKKIYVRDSYACADPKYRLSIRSITTKAWHDLFCYHLFINPPENSFTDSNVDFTIIDIPEFVLDAENYGTNGKNFVIINFSKKIILICGTGYAGEIKKGIFSVLNYLLPLKHNVLTMHCAANVGSDGDVAIFFGLSGTGKTTLSADANRMLIGDDEHGWSDDGIFNFEGGCYAKTINLSPENEPNIYNAIRFGSIVENMCFLPNSRSIDYANDSITENTRCAYTIEYVSNAIMPSLAGNPKNIFFLSCDTYGTLPPVARLTASQAMKYFILGYTAIVSGTEVGNLTPKPTFSACFGEAFLPFNPVVYTKMLGEKIKKNTPNIWLINTGWTGGPYGIGRRMLIKHTRAIVNAAIEGKLDNVPYAEHPIFKLHIPKECPGVPEDILDPENTWADKTAYKKQAEELSNLFEERIKKLDIYLSQTNLDA